VAVDSVAVDDLLARVGAPILLWMFVVALVVIFAVASALMIRAEFAGEARPVFRPPGAHGSSVTVVEPTSAGVRIAGSGSNLPLTRLLVEGFWAGRAGRDASREIVVFESIGSTGGVKAVHDGAIDLGLISRPLRPRERALELVTIPYARVAVVAAVHRSVSEHSLPATGLVEIFSGARRRWSDGAPIVVLQREQGDSSHEAVSRVLPGFAAANERAYQRGLWRIVYRDRAMQEALRSTPGAIGLFDLGAVTSADPDARLEILAVDGVHPSPSRVADGTYPYFKDLAFVSAGPPRGLAAEFVAFSKSPAGQAIIRASGYAPRSGEALR
jgi:phosphate transport system substrate-binding protein